MLWIGLLVPVDPCHASPRAGGGGLASLLVGMPVFLVVASLRLAFAYLVVFSIFQWYPTVLRSMWLRRMVATRLLVLVLLVAFVSTGGGDLLLLDL